MKNESSYLYDAEIIRQAEQQRSKVIVEFFTGLFSRDKHAVTPAHPAAAE